MTRGPCPSCGAPVVFTAGSARVVVCGHCQTVVGRKGDSLERRGKVAALVDTDSPLQLGLTGRHQGQGFRLVGHLQKSRGDALWDEWYLELDDGRRGWLSESEGALHLSFFEEERPDVEHAALRPLTRLPFRDRELTVEEVSEARLVSAAGELPDDVHGDARLLYADATGPGGLFATLDFGERSRGAELYVGRRVDWPALGLDPSTLPSRERKVALVQARCTECNGPLELRAPDRTRRVGCPYCGALLDASEGKLAFLQLLEKPDHEPWIPLGAKGTLEGTDWTCIGMLVRHCVVEGTRYPWDEYLLWNRGRGFAWLVLSEGHWTFLEGIPAAELSLAGSGQRATLKGECYRLFSHVRALTDAVQGELYWEASAGDEVRAREFVAPPRLVSVEEAGEEVSVSAGRYVPPKEVQAAFGLTRLPRPRGVASSQPNPRQARIGPTLRWGFVYGLLALGLWVVAALTGPKGQFADLSLEVPAQAQPGTPELVVFHGPFDVPETMTLEVGLSAPVLQNDWLGVEVDLVDEVTGELRARYVQAEYWSGRDSDGTWSEGSRESSGRFAAVAPGRYGLRIAPSFDPSPLPRTYRVTVEAASPSLLPLVVLWVLLGAWMVATVVRSSSFESLRWSESNVTS